MVSIIIPTYNRAYLLRDAVQSVLEQTYQDTEIIVIDDGSTDNTREVLRSLRDDRIRYHYQKNAGACAARNTGIGLATGEYIAFQDSDDIWYPNKLEEQLNAAERTHADIVICQRLYSVDHGESFVIPPMEQSGFINPHDLPFGIGTQSILARRCVAESIPFDSEMLRFQDMDWLFRALKQYSLYGLKEVLYDYHVYPDSISASDEKLVQAVRMLQNKYPTLKYDYPIIAKEFCQYMLFEADKYLKRDRNRFYELAFLAFSFQDTTKNPIKAILAKAKILDRYYLFKRFLSSRIKRSKKNTKIANDKP